MNTHAEHTRGLFACLGEASRYRIVAALSAGDRCVTDLAREVALSQSCTTRHLQALERVGLVAGVRQGKRVVFRLRTDDPRVGGLLEWIRIDARAEAPRPAHRSTGGVPAPDAASGRHHAGVGGSGAGAPAQAAPDEVPARSQNGAEREGTPARSVRDIEDFLL